MATKNGYLGPINTHLYGSTFTAPLQATTVGRLNPGSNGFWNLSGGTILRLESDEYPTAIALTGYQSPSAWENQNTEYGSTVTLYLCTVSGVTRSNQQQIGSISVGAGSYSTATFTKTLSNPTTYQNASLYLYGTLNSIQVPSGNSGYITFQTTTAFSTKTVSLVVSGAGTATISLSSLSRGQTATITVTPNSGYKFDHITVSNGSVTRNDVNTFVYTMSTPAEDSVVTVYFKKFTASAKVGGIIYADWYNQ